MVGGSSQVKQMQSLWPEWIWHPLKCGLLLSLLPPSINLSLHCLLLLLPFSPCLFLLYPQSLYQLYLAPHFPLMFFFFFCVSFLFLFDPSVKPPLGRLSRSPCWYDRGFAPQWRWPLTSQAFTSLFIPFLSFSLIWPHSLAAFHLWVSAPARVNHRNRERGE